MAKILPTDFAKGGMRLARSYSLPTFIVTSLAKSAVPASKSNKKRPIAYSVDSLDKLASAFEENERLVNTRA